MQLKKMRKVIESNATPEEIQKFIEVKVAEATTSADVGGGENGFVDQDFKLIKYDNISPKEFCSSVYPPGSAEYKECINRMK